MGKIIKKSKRINKNLLYFVLIVFLLFLLVFAEAPLAAEKTVQLSVPGCGT